MLFPSWPQNQGMLSPPDAHAAAADAMEHYDVLSAQHLQSFRARLLWTSARSITSCGSATRVVRTTVATLPEYSARGSEGPAAAPWPAAPSAQGADSLGRKAREFACSPFGTQ
jgi:hypothetical protein